MLPAHLLQGSHALCLVFVQPDAFEGAEPAFCKTSMPVVLPVSKQLARASAPADSTRMAVELPTIKTISLPGDAPATGSG